MTNKQKIKLILSQTYTVYVSEYVEQLSEREAQNLVETNSDMGILDEFEDWVFENKSPLW